MSNRLIITLSLVGLAVAFLIGGVLTLLEKRSLRKFGTGVLLGQPRVYPTDLIASLKQLFAERPEVKAAYLAEIYQPASKVPPHAVIGLEIDGAYDAVQEAAGLVARRYVKKGEPIDFMPIADDVVSQYMTAQTTPFFSRSGSGNHPREER